MIILETFNVEDFHCDLINLRWDEPSFASMLNSFIDDSLEGDGFSFAQFQL